jgi:phosphoglucomutase
MEQHIIERAQAWGKNSYFSDSDREEINQLLKNLDQNGQELTERFYRDLEFGTGGLRAPMGMGQNRMNKYNVRRATQALCEIIKKNFGTGSAVISYDSRNNSKKFAEEAAGVFAANGIKAIIFHSLTPTPMLSYAVRYYKAQAGIMITASHNPPIYNGYKAFWNDGAQVVPPIDKEIINAYNSLNNWSLVKFVPFEEALQSGLAEWTDEKVDNSFYDMIKKEVIQNPTMCRDFGKDISIVYTALHGTGQIPCNHISEKLGFTNFYSIPEQALPDGNFSTVKSPNPEDPKALKLAIDYMLKHNADVVFGTDPDCDRLGVVVNINGKPEILNGNQIGVLMLYYILTSKAAKQQIKPGSYTVKSIVTSPLQNSVVESFGVRMEETLTGFKWMADKIREIETHHPSNEFIFASEESFGYMPHNKSRDKDGVSSVALMSEIVLYYKKQGKNLIQVLDEIYEKYGFYYESLLSNDYEGISGTQKINRIMEYFRNFPEAKFAGEEIESREDYNLGLRLPKSNVLSFNFKSGNKLFLRPSGTEPKIKFYTMVRVTEGDLKTKKDLALTKVEEIEAAIRACCEKA